MACDSCRRIQHQPVLLPMSPCAGCSQGHSYQDRREQEYAEKAREKALQKAKRREVFREASWTSMLQLLPERERKPKVSSQRLELGTEHHGYLLESGADRDKTRSLLTMLGMTYAALRFVGPKSNHPSVDWLMP